MNTYRTRIITRTSLLLIGIWVVAQSVEATPPSRQTPTLVAKDRQGAVDVGPCQLPPAVGGRACTPNARDYGYYDTTWRVWPTQQRFDQRFPQAIGATPVKPQASRPAREAPLAPPTYAPNQGAGGNTGFELPDYEPESLNGFSAPASPVAPTTSGLNPDPTATLPNTTTLSPILTPSTSRPDTLSPPPPSTSLDALSPVPSGGPMVVPAAPSTLDPDLAPLGAPEAPGQDLSSPLEDSAGGLPAVDAASSGDSFGLPDLSRNSTEIAPQGTPQSPAPNAQRSILNSVTQADASTFENMGTAPFHSPSVAAYIPHPAPAPTPTPAPARSPFDIAAAQQNLVAATYESPAPASEVAQTTYVNASESPKPTVETATVETATVGEALAETPPSPSAEAPVASTIFEAAADHVDDFESRTGRIGLDGFCPVTLIQTEEWVEGSKDWAVVHHGITYHLASGDQVQAFLENPEKFTPVLDGCDPIALQDRGQKIAGVTENCAVLEGKLYMFASEETMNTFFENVETYKK